MGQQNNKKNKKQVHLIANAHLDPVWLWRWQEGCSEALSTFRTAAELIQEFPEFLFNHNEAILYQWVKENDSRLYEIIRNQIREGKWHIMGGWYLQPDCNMPSGESIIRNIEAGRRFFQKEFGKVPQTAINFDSFGHSRGLVQILVQAGYSSYVVCRPAKDWYGFEEQDFIWEGFAGASLLVHRSDENYNSVWGHAAEELKSFLKEKQGEEVTLFLWGVGDHGGGPSRKDLSDLAQSINSSEDYHILHSTPEAYFEELALSKPELKKVASGLNPVAQGCYTSQIRIKQKHRLLENELYSAEKMAAAAELIYGRAYPKAVFDETVRTLLFSEFHDALPGSGSPYVEEDTLRLLDHGLELLSREKHSAALALASTQPRVKEGSSAVLFYNPHPYDITGVFVCETGLPQQNWTTDFMYPAAEMNGVRIPTQAEKECSNFNLDWRKRVVVQATLKAGSMSRMDVYFHSVGKRPDYPEIMSGPRFIFDNGRMRVIIDTTTGLLLEYSVEGKTYLTKGSFQLAAFDDTCNSWGSGTDGSHARRNFQLLLPQEGSEFCGLTDKVIPPVRVIEDGEVRTTVEAVFGMHNSKAYLRYQLPKTGTGFDLELGLYHQEKHQALKLMLLPPSTENVYTGQIMFGREQLRQGEETVSQKWVMLSDKETGNAIAVFNKGTYGASYAEGELGITLLRSAGYAAADAVMGKTLQEEQWAPRMEQGERYYHFRIAAGQEEELGQQLDRMAQAYNEEPYGFAYCPPGYGRDEAPGRDEGFLRIDNPRVILSAMKRSEDRDGYIMRLYESSGTDTAATVSLLNNRIRKEIAFHAFEIKTFFLAAEEGKLTETTLIELD